MLEHGNQLAESKQAHFHHVDQRRHWQAPWIVVVSLQDPEDLEVDVEMLGKLGIGNFGLRKRMSEDIAERLRALRQ